MSTVSSISSSTRRVVLVPSLRLVQSPRLPPLGCSEAYMSGVPPKLVVEAPLRPRQKRRTRGAYVGRHAHRMPIHGSQHDQMKTLDMAQVKSGEWTSLSIMTMRTAEATHTLRDYAHTAGVSLWSPLFFLLFAPVG